MSDPKPCDDPLDPRYWVQPTVEQLRSDLAAAIRERDEAHGTRERLAALLDGVALALKGPPDELTMHGWHDLPALAATERQRAERAEAQLFSERSECDCLRAALKETTDRAEAVARRQGERVSEERQRAERAEAAHKAARDELRNVRSTTTNDEVHGALLAERDTLSAEVEVLKEVERAAFAVDAAACGPRLVAALNSYADFSRAALERAKGEK